MSPQKFVCITCFALFHLLCEEQKPLELEYDHIKCSKGEKIRKFDENVHNSVSDRYKFLTLSSEMDIQPVKKNVFYENNSDFNIYSFKCN